VNRDDTYDVRYADGDEERRVLPENIRSVGGSTTESKRPDAYDSDLDSTRKFSIGDKIEARFKGGAKWFPGRVMGVNRDGSYAIRYADGDEDNKVLADHVRAIGDAEMEKPRAKKFDIGDKIGETRFARRHLWISRFQPLIRNGYSHPTVKYSNSR
jgi:hypothetical protein